MEYAALQHPPAFAEDATDEESSDDEVEPAAEKLLVVYEESEDIATNGLHWLNLVEDAVDENVDESSDDASKTEEAATGKEEAVNGSVVHTFSTHLRMQLRHSLMTHLMIM